MNQPNLRKIEIWERINREDVQNHRDKIFLFGDNLKSRGFGGQAKEMRGEENSIGIPTKKAPNNDPTSFFTDNELAANKTAIDEAFDKIPSNKTLVIPKAGIGTGLARLVFTAPQTFKYLNQKFAEIGFDNLRGKIIESKDKKVVIQGNTSLAQKRLLDLSNIQTQSLKLLSPSREEIEALKSDRQTALAVYADRLRGDYKADKDELREGLKLLSDSVDKGDQITITCPCHNGEMCHADVVKMAVEKVNLHIKDKQLHKSDKFRQSENQKIPSDQKNPSPIQKNSINPRTQRAINEILAFSENDRLLEQINRTDGRNRSEQASYLGKHSQFVREIYERGATVNGSNLIVPQENLNAKQPLFTTTQEYAVKRIGKFLNDEIKAKEIAPTVVEYGNKISGLTADGETRLKVFNWIYNSLEGKSDFLGLEETKDLSKSERFENTLEQISNLAEEMERLEPSDKLEFVPLVGFEQMRDVETIYHLQEERSNENLSEYSEELRENQIQEQDAKINPERFERIELKGDVPKIPEELTTREINNLLTNTLPEVDRKLESGVSRKEILKPFNEMVWQSAKDDTLNRLEKIYQKQNIAKSNDNFSRENIKLNQNVKDQSGRIDLFHQNIIELKNPDEFPLTEKEAINTFFRVKKIETGNLLEKLDEIRQRSEKSDDKTLRNKYKRQLNKIKESKPSFAYKLENSSEIVFGEPSKEIINERNFVSSYIDYQLKQPDIRLRHTSERYRNYAKQLENVSSREELVKTASDIRIENAEIGFKWKDIEKGEKETLSRPLSQKEMQFLFTENSPAHYTSEMTALKLSYAHAGASRRQLSESLLRGEISPSPEAKKLLESLESRLERRELGNAVKATKHFFESLKTSNENLKYKNDFDHRETYRKLPPQEKDFIYLKATEQKENLEYRLIFKELQISKTQEFARDENQKVNPSKLEESFYLLSQFNQARILGDTLGSSPSVRQEISGREANTVAILLTNYAPEKIDLFARELRESKTIQNLKIGEVLDTFNKAEISTTDEKVVISIKLPENRLVEEETYRELLDKIYPDEDRDRYKFSNFNKKTLNWAREKGQDETIENWRDELKSNEIKSNVAENVFSTEQTIIEKFDRIKDLQETARKIKRENQNLAEKYKAHAAAKLLKQDIRVPSQNDQNRIVQRAFDAKGDVQSSNNLHKQFFEAIQKEMTISDFQKYTANEKLLAEAKFQIKHEFTEISEQKEILEKSIFKSSNDRDKNESLEQTYAEIQQQEYKPLSLQLFEKEFEKAEKQILSKNLSEKILENSAIFENEKLPNLETLFPPQEREQIKLEAIETATNKLKPKELDSNHQKIPTEVSEQALATHKQLEIATEIFQTSSDKLKINESFEQLDEVAAKLNQIREDYSRKEKLTFLRSGIKNDIADLFKQNPNLKESDLVDQTTKILDKHLDKNDMDLMADRTSQVSSLSKEISLQIEAKQNSKDKDYSVFNYAQSLSNFTQKNCEIKEVSKELAKINEALFYQR